MEAKEGLHEQDGCASMRAPIAVDERAGRYELLVKVASGGMGSVWAARLKLDSGFEKIFAVKTLLAHLEGDSTFREMFLDEARLAAGIAHPNVAQIIDMGADGYRLYFVMEWIEGVSLRELSMLAKKRGETLPIGVLLRVLADTCAGLGAIHEHTDREDRPLEIVHRDVSPQNILLTPQGLAKICDLGVAKARDRLTEATMAGTVKGKLRFMSPEHAGGGPIDLRSDVWGVGAVLYAMLAGRPPYEAESDVGVMKRLLARLPPDPLTDAPEPLRRVLARSLAVDPAHRYPTAAALGDDLDAAARELGVLATHRDVTAYVKRIAGDDIRARRDAIHRALDHRDSVRIPAAAPAPAPMSGTQLRVMTPTPRSSVSSFPPPPSGVVAHESAIPLVADLVEVTIVNRTRQIRWGLAALGAAALAIVAFSIVLRSVGAKIPEARAVNASALDGRLPAPQLRAAAAPTPPVTRPTTTAEVTYEADLEIVPAQSPAPRDAPKEAPRSRNKKRALPSEFSVLDTRE